MKSIAVHCALICACLSLLGSCALGLTSSLEIPTGITATADEVEQITISWNEVSGADHYYVYRAESAAAEFWEDGPYGSVPYANTTATSYVDTSVEAQNYYYRVSAVQLFTNSESEKSEIVTGSSVAAAPEWQLTQLVLGTTGHVDLAVDFSGTTADAYALTVPDAASAEVTARSFVAGGFVLPTAAAFGTVDGTVKRSAALAAAEESLFAGLVDETTAALTVWKLGSADDSFSQITTPATDAARSSGPLLSAGATSATDVWFAYAGADGQTKIYRYNGTTLSSVAPPAAINANGSTRVLADLEVEANPTGVAIAYLVTDAASDVVTSGAATWNGTGWDSAAFGMAPTQVNAFAATLDPAGVAPVDDDVYALQAGDTAYYLEDLANSINETVGPLDAGGLPAFGRSALAVATYNANVYVLYEDLVAAGARVITRDLAGSPDWTEFSSDDFPDSGTFTLFTLKAAENALYAAWIDDGTAFLRAYN